MSYCDFLNRQDYNFNIPNYSSLIYSSLIKKAAGIAEETSFKIVIYT